MTNLQLSARVDASQLTIGGTPNLNGNLATNLLQRLVQGQLTLLRWKIDDCLQAPHGATERQLNHLIGEVKDWLYMVDSRTAQKLGARAARILSGLYDRIFPYEWRSGTDVIEWVHSADYHDPGVVISEFHSSELTASVRSELNRLFCSRSVDQAPQGRNIGFEFGVSADEFRTILGSDSCINITITEKNSITGALVMYSTLDLVTDGGKKNVEDYAAQRGVRVDEVAYCDVVFTERSASGRMTNTGTLLLPELVRAASQTLAFHKIKYLVGEVRAGNAVEEYYKKLGSVDTELSRTKNGHVLKLYSHQVRTEERLDDALSTLNTGEKPEYESGLRCTWIKVDEAPIDEVLTLPHIVANARRADPRLVTSIATAFSVARDIVDALPHLRDEVTLNDRPLTSGREVIWLWGGPTHRPLCIYHGRTEFDEWFIVGPPWPDVYSTFNKVLAEALVFLTQEIDGSDGGSDLEALIRETREKCSN